MIHHKVAIIKIFKLFLISVSIIFTFILGFIIYFFTVINPQIDEAIKTENGLIFRPSTDETYIQRLTGLGDRKNFEDMTPPPDIIGGPYMRVVSCTVYPDEISEVIQKLRLEFKRVASVSSYGMIEYDKNSWLSDHDKKEEWTVYEKEYTREDLFALIEGFGADRNLKRYSITLLYNGGIHKCIIIVLAFPL